MENRVQYIIDLVVQDKKLRQKMAQLNWEDLIGSNGKDLSDLFGSEAEDAIKKLKTIFHGINIDWSKILGAKDLGRLEQQMAKVLSSSKKQISAFATMDDTSGIQRTVEYVAELGNQLKSLGSNFDAAQLAKSMTSFMGVLTPLSAKIETLAKEPAKVEAAFDRLFNNKTLNSADQTINKIATAMATLGINKSVVTNMKQVRSEMDKLVKSAKPIKLDIDYGSLEDADLLSILQKKYKNQTTDLSKLLGYEWGNLTMNMPDITDAEKTKKHLLAILELEKKIISIDGKSPVDEFFADDTGFDSIKELRREFERLTKTAEESVKETVGTLKKSVKTIQQSITEKLGKLAEVKIDLTLDETNKTQFKNSIDTFVSDLNSNKYGEINSVKVDLDLNEPTKTTNRGRPKSTSKEQIEATKANIQNALNVAEEERNKVNSLLADLNERHSNELEKNKNYDNEPQSARLKGSINKAEEELKSLEKTIISYNYLLSQMDDYEFAKSVVSDWKKFSSAAQNIRISQDRLLSDTRKWRAEMNDALKFRYQWKVDGTADEFDRLSYALTSMSEENPIKLMPDIDFIANAIEEGLAGREINVKLAADGPIKATGGIVGNLGVVPIVSSTNKSTTQAASLSHKPVSVTQPQPSKQETVKSQSHVYVDTDVDAIIKYVEDQVNSNRELNDSYLKLLKSIGITDKEVSNYIKKVRNKEIEVPKEVIRQYGSENTFLKRLEKTKESVNFNEKLPFYDVANDILKLKNTIDNNPDDEIKIRNASEQIKSLLIKSVVDSFKLYIQKSKERFARNEEEIKKQTDIKNVARKAYESDSEKKKRLNAIDSQKQKVDELESNSAITEYETLLQLIEDAKKEGDKDVINSFLKQEQETLPSVKQGYQDLIKARQKLKELEKEDPNDPNLLKIIEADKRIASLKRSNEKIIRSRQAYENIGFPLNQLEELINTGDKNAIYDLVIDKILNKSDIVQSMGYKRKESSATDAIYLFDTMAQKLMTKTIEMVQQAIGIAQKTTEELNRRVINENMLNDLRGIASKKKALSSIYNWGSEPQSSEVFEKINSLFADELEDARQMGESGATTDREKAYVNFANALDSATKAADGFRAVYDSWSDSEKQSFKDSSNKEEWFKKKYNNPAEANKNYLAYTKNDAAVKALINSIQYKKPNTETGEPEQYGIYKEITNQLKGYVFRVTLVDDKGSHIVDVGTDNLVKLGKLSKPDKWYNPGSLNETNFLIGDPYSDYKLPEDLSEISDIKVYNTPSGKRSYDQPRNTETPSSQSTNKKTSVSSSVSEAKRLISNAKRTVDEAENTISSQKILESSNEILESAVQTQEIINNQINSITGGVDVKEYIEHLIQKRDSLKETRNGEKEFNSTSIDPLNNKAFDEANEIIDNAIRKADVARQIAKNPFNIETHSLFEGELPDALKRLLDISQQQKDLKNTLPANQQEAVESQNKIRALQEETKTLVPLINQWADNVINQSDKVVADANKIKEQAAPKLAKDYQKKLTELVNQAMSLSQQIEANPNNEELKNQMQSVIDNIYKLTPLYKKLLDKYNITTKGFLGNENQKKLDIAQKIYENPADQNLWSEFGKVPDAVKKAAELLRRDSELTRQLTDLPSDIVEIDNELDRLKTDYDNAKQAFDNNPTKENRDRRGKAKKAYKTYKNKNEEYRNSRVREYRNPIEQERLQIAREYKIEINKILQWVQRQRSSVGTDIFAGLGNSGQRFKNAQGVVLGWGGKAATQSPKTVDKKQEINKLNTEISQLNALERQAETQAQIVENARERVNLATRQLEIEKELANTSITAERKAELETEYDKNKIRATELGIKSRKFITTSVDADELQNAYLTVVDDLIDQQEESDKKVSKLRSDIAKEQQRLGRLEAERTPEAVAEGKRHTQDSVIKSAISYRASELSNTAPEIYTQLREEAKSEHPLTDFYDYQNPYERQERAIQEAISKKAKEYVKIMMTPEEEQKIINESIVTQKKAIESKETELQAEIAHNNEIVALREQYKLEGEITDEMIAARRNATEEIRRETQIIHQNSEVAFETSETTAIAVSEKQVPTSSDVHYQNYTSGQVSQYDSGGIYNIDISHLATEDTLNAIYTLLSGDTSRTGLSDTERRALEAEREAIRGQLGGLGRNDEQPGDVKSHLYNQFADWLRQIAKEVFNITDIPIDKFKDTIQNIWIPTALKQGATDISQLDMDRLSGQYLIENRLGVQVPEIPIEEAKETSKSIMTIGKAIKIIDNAIGKSTAKTTVGMAKAYANKIHGNAEIVEAAKFLYNTPDSKITTKYGKSVKTKLKNFRDAWASNQQGVKESTQPIEENSDYKKAVEIVRNAIGDFKGRSDAKKSEKYNSLGQEVKDAGNLIYNNLANATKEEKALFDKLKRLRDAAKKIEGQVVTPSIENVNGAQVNNEIIHKTLPDGSPWEGTKQEWDEFNAWLSGESIEVDVKPTVQPGAVEQAIDESIANNPPDASIVKADFADGTHFEGTKEELQEMITMLGDPIAQTIEASKQQVKNEQAKTAETIKQVENEKTETVEGNNQLNNIESLKAREAEINAKLLADDKLKTAQSVDKTASGGIIGAMNELAKDNTLHQILTAIGEISKRQMSSISGKGNSAQDLLMRLQKMLAVGVDQKRERVAYIDLATGAMTDSIEGTNEIIDSATFNTLRKVYQDSINFNAQVHTHADADDPYFSPKDLNQFADDVQKGITKQILLSKNAMTVLDMADVKDISGLLDALVKTEHNFEALSTTAEKFGATYISSIFDEITPYGLVKMLGIKGIESKYTESETRDSAVSGVLVEDAKEAADVLQESTGRAIKKTVERVGAELMTITEKTDAKGNKTWSNQINNKYEKAALATNKAFEKLGLANQFGEGTEAQIALDNYNDKYSKFIDLVNRFKQNPKQDGLQEEFNKLLPELDEAETKLNKLIIAKNKFIGNKEPITIFTQDQVGIASNSLKKVAIEQFAGISDNMAFNGISETPNGTRLLVDVLKDGFISQYAIEVDKATGQVREFMMAETALVNAFQNVNKAMKQNESVMANIVPTDVTSSEQLQDFLNNANSPMWDAYKFALADMEKYTLDLLTSMKDGKSVSKEQEDYLMSLSEKVIRLGKDVQKTSGAFNNFWAQNPDSVSNLNFSYDPNNRDEKVRSELEKEAIKRANRENSEYKFLSFDNDTLQYELTDLEGNITKVTLVWNELYKQVATVSNKSVGAIDPVVAKIQKYEEALRQATDNKYLRDNDASLKGFTDSLNNIEWLIQGIKDGTETFETAKEKLVQYRQEALKFGQDALKIAKANEKLYTGTSELRSASRQRDKIIGMFGEDFDESDLPSIQQYKKEYQGLIDLYNGLNEKKKLYDINEQEGLRQRAVRVQAIGSQLLTSIKQAEKLQQLVDESGTYKDVRGNDIKLGGKQSLSEQINNVQDLKTTMLDYVQNGLKIADLEHVKFSNRTKQLTAEVRTSKDTVAEIVVEYNKATNALYAYNLQEKESLTGIRGVIQGFKSKLHSILQYTASITSIYRVFGELKRGIQYVKEIDSALTELKKVTDETEATYDKFLNTAAKTADKVGSTIKEVVSSTADWARLNI